LFHLLRIYFKIRQLFQFLWFSREKAGFDFSAVICERLLKDSVSLCKCKNINVWKDVICSPLLWIDNRVTSTQYLSSSSRTYPLFLNFSTMTKKKKGSRASAFIAKNGIKARWKRASVVFRGLDERIRRMDVGCLVRIYLSIHLQRNSERYGDYIF